MGLGNAAKQKDQIPFSYQFASETSDSIFSLSSSAFSLECFVGLGNTAKRKEQKVVQCPEDKYYVCMKMFGGGMGDQIRRKCEKFSIPVSEH